jgi:hypothetical protein
MGVALAYLLLSLMDNTQVKNNQMLADGRSVVPSQALQFCGFRSTQDIALAEYLMKGQA